VALTKGQDAAGLGTGTALFKIKSIPSSANPAAATPAAATIIEVPKAMISAIPVPPWYRSFPTICYNMGYVTLSRARFLFNNGQFRKEICEGAGHRFRLAKKRSK
jgi:hypothetical protein